MLDIVFTLTFDSSPIKGEGDSVGWLCCLVVTLTPPCGYCLKASMTGRIALPCGFPPTRE